MPSAAGRPGRCTRTPSGRRRQVRGVFDVRPTDGAKSVVKLTDIADGTSTTIALGEAAGGTPGLLIRDRNRSESAGDRRGTGQPAIIDQSWGAAGVTDASHPWYGSVLATTAQYGLAPDPRDEPMNRPLLTPTVFDFDPFGDNRTGRDSVSGFRSRHTDGCNFLFCDGGVRFVRHRSIPRSTGHWLRMPVVSRSESGFLSGPILFSMPPPLECSLFPAANADGPTQMAADEVLLECAATTGRPALRFYTWEPATLSLGYFQLFADRLAGPAGRAPGDRRRGDRPSS